MFKAGKISRCLLCIGLSVLFALTTLFSDNVYARKCGDVLTDEDIAKHFEKNGCNTREIYRISVMAGEQAITGLQNLLKSNRCDQFGRSHVYIALARLGDNDAFKELEKQLYASRFNDSAIEHLAFVRNNQAISILMTYFSRYRADPTLLDALFGNSRGDSPQSVEHLGERVHFGRTLSIYSPLARIGNEIWGTTFTWNTPAVDLPVRPVLGVANLDDWENWWNKQKDIPFRPLDYSNISNPHFRCLARMAEWGLPEAVMLMTELPGNEKEVESILKTFRGENRMPFGSMSGTIDVALLRLGDGAILTALAHDLGMKESWARDRALQKIRIASTKAGIETLLNALEKDITGVSEVETNEFREEILNALSEMVENPPLGIATAPTPENFLKWKQWWANNKDTVVLKRPSVNDMTWGHSMGR